MVRTKNNNHNKKESVFIRCGRPKTSEPTKDVYKHQKSLLCNDK